MSCPRVGSNCFLKKDSKFEVWLPKVMWWSRWVCVVPRLLLTLCPSPSLPEEEQAALPHCCHHQLPGPLCFAGGPPHGLCPLHAPAVSYKPAAVFLQGHLRQGCTQILCFAMSSPTATTLQAGRILPVSGLFFFCCFFKAPDYGGRVSSLMPSTSWSSSSPPRAWSQQVTLGVPTETLSSTNSTVPSPPALMVPCSTSLQEHPVPEKHHPLEPDHSLHPTQCHVVCGTAHHEPRGA